MKNLLLLLCLLTLTSCAMTQDSSVSTRVQPGNDYDGILFKIVIKRWADVQFAGLVGIQQNSSGFTYVLLDGSGIKLLEATLDRQGGENVVVEGGVQPLMDTKIPYYLAVWLERMLMVTTEVQCNAVLPVSFCVENRDSITKAKKARIGPFLHWSTEWKAQNDLADIEYWQPFIGVKVVLQKI